MMNISLLGLSGSGKTCYLYVASHVLRKGVKVASHTISATPTNRKQALRLNIGIEQMIDGTWPDGSNVTLTYPFELKIDGQAVLPFTIYDYRGSMLDELPDDDQYDEDQDDDQYDDDQDDDQYDDDQDDDQYDDDQDDDQDDDDQYDDDQDKAEKIFDTFEQSSCIVILVDGGTMVEALKLRRGITDSMQLKARKKINYIESLIYECNQRMERNVPILLTITKRDIFLDEELEAGKKLLQELLPSVFSLRNDKIVGITAITIGDGLQNENNKLMGELILNTEGNVHLPILFALFQNIEDLVGDDGADEARELIFRLFVSNQIDFYRGGKPAFPTL